MRFIKEISLFIVLSIVIVMLSHFLETNFLFTYLKGNIIGLLLTLLAINTATLGLISSQIHEFLSEKPDIDFKETIKEMRLSLKEQIWLIAISIILLIVCDSAKITFSYKEIICNTLMTTVLLYSINILWDICKSVLFITNKIKK